MSDITLGRIEVIVNNMERSGIDLLGASLCFNATDWIKFSSQFREHVPEERKRVAEVRKALSDLGVCTPPNYDDAMSVFDTFGIEICTLNVGKHSFSIESSHSIRQGDMYIKVKA